MADTTENLEEKLSPWERAVFALGGITAFGVSSELGLGTYQMISETAKEIQKGNYEGILFSSILIGATGACILTGIYLINKAIRGKP